MRLRQDYLKEFPGQYVRGKFYRRLFSPQIYSVLSRPGLITGPLQINFQSIPRFSLTLSNQSLVVDLFSIIIINIFPNIGI